jgi:transposase InsO family protein
MQRSLKANSITQSMSRKGECHDNAVAENFFNTLKTELISQQTYQTRVSLAEPIDQPTTLREYKSMIVARYSQPCFV